MGKILVTIRGDTVTIYNGGIRSVSSISEWKSDSKEEILLEYIALKEIMKGGEIFE